MSDKNNAWGDPQLHSAVQKSVEEMLEESRRQFEESRRQAITMKILSTNPFSSSDTPAVLEKYPFSKRGAYLKGIREGIGLSRQSLAVATECKGDENRVSLRTIGNIETGARVRPQTLHAYVEVLNSHLRKKKRDVIIIGELPEE